jgi:hypothetical protein
VPGVLELVVIISDASFFSLLVEVGGAEIFFLKRKCPARPRPTFRTLLDAARRLTQPEHTFEAMSGDLGLPREEYDRDFFKPCAAIDRRFGDRKFDWAAVVAANDEERTQSALGSFYVCDGAHKSLALARRLPAGETTYRPVETLHLVPRR